MSRRRADLMQALLAAAAVLYLSAMVATGARPRNAQFVAFEAAGVMAVAPAGVNTVELHVGPRSWTLAHTPGGWTLGAQTLDAHLAEHLNLAVRYLHTARPVRKLNDGDVADRSEFGLETPALSAALTVAGGERFAVDFGNPSTDGMLQYMRVRGDTATYLMSRFVGEEWQAVAAGLP